MAKPACPASFSGLIDRVFNTTSTVFGMISGALMVSTGRTRYRVNITETDKNYELQLVAPRTEKKDFKISLEGDLLTISHEHKEGTAMEKQNGTMAS